MPLSLPGLTESQVNLIDKSGVFRRGINVGRRIADLEAATTEVDDVGDAVSLATSGVVAWNKISLATNPTASDTVTVGGDTYQFRAAGANVTNDAYIAVVLDSTNDLSAAALAAAINRTARNASGLLANGHATIFKTDGETPADSWGNENVKAAYDASGNILWIFAADAPGGTLVDGTAPDLACTDALTAVVAWTFANLDESTSVGQKYEAVARWTVPVTTTLITATLVDFVLPFYSANAVARVIGYTSSEVLKEGIADYMSLAAGPMANTTIATLNFAAGGGDLANTDLAWCEVWCPA